MIRHAACILLSVFAVGACEQDIATTPDAMPQAATQADATQAATPNRQAPSSRLSTSEHLSQRPDSPVPHSGALDKIRDMAAIEAQPEYLRLLKQTVFDREDREIAEGAWRASMHTRLFDGTRFEDFYDFHRDFVGRELKQNGLLRSGPIPFCDRLVSTSLKDVRSALHELGYEGPGIAPQVRQMTCRSELGDTMAATIDAYRMLAILAAARDLGAEIDSASARDVAFIEAVDILGNSRREADRVAAWAALRDAGWTGNSRLMERFYFDEIRPSRAWTGQLSDYGFGRDSEPYPDFRDPATQTYLDMVPQSSSDGD